MQTNCSQVGQSAIRLDALEKVTGKARYASSFHLPNSLYGKILHSPHAHARIVNIDVSRAKSLPGVRAVVTAMDAPKIDLGTIYHDRQAFPIDLTVRYVGDAVAAVAAETEDIAEEALGLIAVQYEKLPAVFDTEEAFKQNPPAVVHPNLRSYEGLQGRSGAPWRPDPTRPNTCHHFRIVTGNTEEAFKTADLTVEDRYFVPRVHHCQLEPSVSVAWFELDGTLRLMTTAQGIHRTKDIMCRAFGLPASKVRVEAPYVGGAFGGRGRSITEPYAVLLSQKTGGRPVKVAYSREEHFHSARSRVPVVTYIKDGVRRDGTLLARQLLILVDMGAYADTGIQISKVCAYSAVGSYRVPNFSLDSYGVYTNTPMSGPFRGFGGAEVIWAIENQMDVIAGKLGIDPVALREKNLLKEGEINASGQVTHSIGAKGCIEKVRHWIGWDDKPPEMGGSWRIGHGLAIGNKLTNSGARSSAIVKIMPDGTVEVRHSSDEVGNGVNTVVAQFTAEAFGIPVDRIRVVSGDTSICPYGDPPVASRETFYMGHAVIEACRDAKRQLFEVAAGRLGIPADALETSDGKVYARSDPARSLLIQDLFVPRGIGSIPGKGEILGTCTYTVRSTPEDPQTGQSPDLAVSYTHGAVAAKVAVHVKTGQIKLLKVAACYDAKPVNPKMLEGQIEGGVAMGLGAALQEQMIIDDTGKLANPSFVDYKIMTASDLPLNADVAAMSEPTPLDKGPYGAKGIGEVVMIPVAPAISNAVCRAVGVRIKELPMTPEKIVKAMSEQEARQDSGEGKRNAV